MNIGLIIFIGYFVAIIMVTAYSSRRIRKAPGSEFESEIFVGGRTLGPFSLAILVAAGVASTGTFVSGPAVAAGSGPGYILLFSGGQILMNVIILGILAKKINIVGRRVNANSYIDIFAKRYENYKPLVSILIVAILIVVIALCTAEFTGGSRVIQQMTGIPFEFSLIAFAVIICAYSVFGGLRGVSFVGVLQGILMTLASLILVGGSVIYFGGFWDIFDQLREIDPDLMRPGGSGEGAPITEMLGYWLTYGLAYLGLPWAVQAALGYRSTRTMKVAIVVGIVIAGMWTILISFFSGPAARVFAPDLEVLDFSIPNLAQGTLPAVLFGLVLAGIAGAGQSTIAAMFILAAGSITVSGQKILGRKQLSSRGVRWLSLISTSGVGLISVLLALNPPPSLQYIITFAVGASGASFAVPLILALYWPRSNKYGATVGVLVGMIAYLLFSNGVFGENVLQDLSIVIACFLSLVGAVIVSLLTRPPSKATISAYFGERPSDAELESLDKM